MQQHGVIFDMDGVLVDSYDAHFDSWRRLAANHGVEMTERQFAETFGWTSRDIIPRFWPDHAGADEIAAWDAEKEAIYREVILADFPEMDGAGALIASLHAAGFAMVIGSSGPPENVAAVMKGLSHAEHIAATVDGMQVARGKPDPGIFLLAAEKIAVAPALCAVIEDAPSGIEAALGAGMTAIAVTGTVDRESLTDAHVIVDSLEELTPHRIAASVAEARP